MWKYLTMSAALLAVWSGSPRSAEIVPCDPMSVGSMWKYSEQTGMGFAEVTRLVTSNDAGVITISETSVSNFSGAEMKQEHLQTLREYDGSIVLKEVSFQGGLMNMEYDIPICGVIEGDVTLLGDETVEVPAGRFDAKVYEIASEGAPSAGDAVAPTSQWATIYYVPGIGTVKSMMVIEIPTPTGTRTAAQNPEAAAVLQESIAAMQKGQDPTKILEKLAGLQQPAAGEGNAVPMEIRKNTITRELIEFAIEQ